MDVAERETRILFPWPAISADISVDNRFLEV